MVRSHFDRAALSARFQQQGFVATHAQLVEMGVSPSTITRRIGPQGPWQRMLPGVVLGHRGTPTRDELLLGGLAFAGEGAVVTGADALRVHGLPVSLADRPVDLLVPMDRQRKSKDYVRIERTRHLPDPRVVGGLPFAPCPRAVIDMCRRTDRPVQVRDLVASGVQKGLVTVGELQTEIRTAARPRTALARAALREVGEGVRSVAEAKARDIMCELGVPAPIWNVRLYTVDGVLVLSPDAYWPQWGAALEIDSYAWHLSPADYVNTLQRSRRMTAHGILVMHFAPVEIGSQPLRFGREVLAFLEVARNRPTPEGIVVRPAA